MAFMDSVIARSKPLWDAAADESFLRQMGEGTLPREQFLDYIIQDSLYLRDYLRAYAMAIVKARSLKEMQVFLFGFRLCQRQRELNPPPVLKRRRPDRRRC